MDRHDPQLHSGHSMARPWVPYFRAHPKQNGLLSSKPRTGLVGAAQWPGPSSLKGAQLPDLVESISLCFRSDSFTSGRSQGWKLGSMRVYSVSYINKNTQITDAYFLALVSHPLCPLVHGAGLIIPVIWGSVLVLVCIAPWAAQVQEVRCLCSLTLSGFGVTEFNLTVCHLLPLWNNTITNLICLKTLSFMETPACVFLLTEACHS